MSVLEDNVIIELYFARDEAAIAATDEKYGKLCHQIAMNILNSRPDTEECINDTWVKMWNSIPPKRPPVLSAYISLIVRRLAINRYHANKRHREMEAVLEELTDCAAVEETEISALAEAINGFLRDLAPIDRKLFVGRYWHAYSVKRLAEGHGMTQNAVSLRLMRTREALRSYLYERGYKV